MEQALELSATEAGHVSFELDRLDTSGDGRIELAGRWFGVRGRRFVRPALTFTAGGETCRLLADLEHKPWAAQDGELWQAAFNGELGAPEVVDLELTVAPDIVIPLRAPGAAVEPSRRQSAAPATTPRLLDALTDELTHERGENRRIRGELERLRSELELLRGELGVLRGERERAEAADVRASAAIARRDAALSKVEEAASERDSARQALYRATTERDAAVQELGRRPAESRTRTRTPPSASQPDGTLPSKGRSPPRVKAM